MEKPSTPSFAYHHAGVSVPDLEQAIEWYEHVLGFMVESRFFIPQANAKAALLVKDALRTEVFEVAGASPLPADRRNPPSDLRTHGNKHVHMRSSISRLSSKP